MIIIIAFKFNDPLPAHFKINVTLRTILCHPSSHIWCTPYPCITKYGSVPLNLSKWNSPNSFGSQFISDCFSKGMTTGFLMGRGEGSQIFCNVFPTRKACFRGHIQKDWNKVWFCKKTEKNIFASGVTFSDPLHPPPPPIVSFFLAHAKPGLWGIIPFHAWSHFHTWSLFWGIKLKFIVMYYSNRHQL